MQSLENSSDADLLESFCTKGSDAALTLLAERYRALVFGVAFGYTRERQTARTVTEQVFTRLARDAKAIRGRVHLADWLRHVAEDECDSERQN